jgi:phage gpG-like protein
MIEQTVKEFVRDMNQLARELEGGNYTTALQKCRPVMQEDIQQHFQNAAAPTFAWPAHAPSTIKRYGRHPLLILTGQLLAAAIGEGTGHVFLIPDGLSAIYGVNKDRIPYAGVHQFGFPDKNIPARTYMWLSEDAIVKCEKEIADHVFTVMTT